jgi:hypothetical protein
MFRHKNIASLIFALYLFTFTFPGRSPAQSVSSNFANLNNVRYASGFPGADAGTKIAAAIADLPSTGGTVDARGLEGAQAAAATIVLNKPLHLILGNATLTGGAAANPVISITSHDVTIEGRGWNNTTIQTATAGNAGITWTGYTRIRIEKLKLYQSAGSPTNVGIGITGKSLVSWPVSASVVDEVSVIGFQDGISVISMGQVVIRNSRTFDNARDGIKIYGIADPPDGSYSAGDVRLDYIHTRNNGVNGLHLDGYVTGLVANHVDSLENVTGILVQNTTAFAGPGQLWFNNCMADANTTNGWLLTAGDQVFINSPWASNRGTTLRNFGLTGVFNVVITDPLVVNFTGHGIDLVGTTNVVISGAKIEDTDQNTANTKDGIYVDAASAGTIITRSMIGNSNLRYAINLVSGTSSYKVTNNLITAGGTGRIYEPTPGADSLVLGNYGVSSGLINAIAGLYALRLANQSATGYGLNLQVGNDSNQALAILNAAGTVVTANLYGNGDIWARRFSATTGTALVAGDFVLSAGWGDTPAATISAVVGTDQATTFTVSAGSANFAANPTVTLTFKDGTWTNNPICGANRGDATAPTTGFTTTTTTATTMVMTFRGTPGAGTYAFNAVCVGR